MVSISGHINYRGPPSVTVDCAVNLGRGESGRCFESCRAADADVVQHLSRPIERRDLRSKPSRCMQAMIGDFLAFFRHMVNDCPDSTIIDWPMTFDYRLQKLRGRIPQCCEADLTKLDRRPVLTLNPSSES
jgi:hypothetical protein